MYPRDLSGQANQIYRKVGVLLAQKTGEPALLSTQRDATESASAKKKIGEIKIFDLQFCNGMCSRVPFFWE